jgi:hypothetical protein
MMKQVKNNATRLSAAAMKQVKGGVRVGTGSFRGDCITVYTPGGINCNNTCCGTISEVEKCSAEQAADPACGASAETA